MSTRTQNLGLFKYDTVNDSALPFDLNVALNDNWDILDNLGSGRNIGEIVASTLPLTDAGLHLLDGSLIQGDGIYSDFVDYMVGLKTTYPDLFTTDASWQEAVTNYGVCGKFVYDSTNNTVRLPKVTGILEGTTDISALGDLVEAGLPNIKGAFRLTGTEGSSAVSGAFVDGEKGGSWGEGHSNSASNPLMQFDASRNAAVATQARGIYRDDCYTVQPQTVKVLYYIVLASSTKSSAQVDIDEIVTDLNNKVSVSDLQEVQCVVETYKKGSSWYRMWSDGWCEQGGYVSSNVLTGEGDFPTTLLVPYINTTYTVVFSRNAGATTTGYVNYFSKNKTETAFTVRVSGSTALAWYACGFTR